MSVTSILLIVLAAGLQVCGHVALKRAQDRRAFIWLMWLWVIILFAPILLLGWQPVPAIVWAIMLVSAICDTVYYRVIARAYQAGDLSLVYPLARGSAPIFILLWSIMLLKERPSVGALLGIALIVVGLTTINLPRLSAWRELRRVLTESAPRWALMAGLCTSLYTTIDRVGVGYLSPLLYTYLTMVLMVVCLTPGTLRGTGWRGLVAELRASRFNSVIAGLVTMASYVIVLVAMYRGLPTSYAGATREISVVFGTIVGIVILKEQGTAMRLAGAVMIATGAGTIALFG